jgi:nicotinamide mononucleotide transporter
MGQLFSVETVFFTILGYPMSYIEFFGTLLYLWSVWLMARGKILTWPVGIVSVLLYMLLFYQIRLYSDTVEQVYYLGASAYGWWRWTARGSGGRGRVDRLKFSSTAVILATAAFTLCLSVAVGGLMKDMHFHLPALFPEEASFPFIDAATSNMSFTAMLLMVFKRTESWLYWIAVDVIGIRLYYVKEVRFVSLLYVILLGMAVSGLFMWMNKERTTTTTQ